MKEIARKLAAPRVSDWDLMTRLARYLVGRPRMVLWYRYPGDDGCIRTMTDGDWACCRRTRRSTTGGITVRGSHVLKFWAKTQAVVSLSSAEAELYEAVKATAETLGTVSLMRDLGQATKGIVMADASATLSLIRRRGRGN